MLGFKLWIEAKAAPLIISRRNEYDDFPYIVVAFPSGARWKYIFPNQHTMEEYLYRYSRNVGRLVSKIKDDDTVKQEQLPLPQS
jgi:hypothetical protein